MTRWTATALVAFGLAACALPAAAQIAGERSFESPIPYFKDLQKWDMAYRAPRTPAGKPDLQGTWSIASLTTMTRPAEFKALVIPQDRIDELTFNSYYNTRMRNDNVQTDPNAGGGDGKGGGDVKGYNNFWIDPGSEYAKVNGEYRSSWITSPAAGTVPFSAEGRAMRASRVNASRTTQNTGPELRSVGDRCLISFGSQAGPPLTNAMYNNHYQIVQTPDHVLIDVEMNHDARIIRIDETKRLPSEVRRWFGDSVARWEGETLVVETVNIHPTQERAGAYPISDKGKVTERFTRVADDQLRYEFTVDDPKYYAGPWSGEIPLRRSKETIYEYACHEGNYALPGILRGMAQGIDTAIESDGE
ncbi:MAG: hypothetical protein SGJ21_15070 [Alphaproteobacteria bacterium]|nr:hypothetical protein [Alphaproteobacteria bacterium]